MTREVVALDNAGERALRIDRERKKALDYAVGAEIGELEPLVGFSARIWAQVSLPYRDPGNIAYWERWNGGVGLTMRPALLTRPDGTRYEAYAYGVLPRQVLVWLATEAVRTQSPQIELGSSMAQFMRKIGLARGGRDAARLTEQLRRLFGSQLSVQGLAVSEGGRGEVTKYFQIADQVQLWFTRNNTLEEGNSGLWSSEVLLSDQFYHSIVDAPVPVDLHALKALGSSPMRLDIYLWSTYRMYSLRAPMKIKWDDLNHQFGAQYDTKRQFKAQFIKNLQAVKIVYPSLDVEPTKDYLVIRPSRTHIAPTKPRRAVV